MAAADADDAAADDRLLRRAALDGARPDIGSGRRCLNARFDGRPRAGSPAGSALVTGAAGGHRAGDRRAAGARGRTCHADRHRCGSGSTRRSPGCSPPAASMLRRMPPTSAEPNSATVWCRRWSSAGAGSTSSSTTPPSTGPRSPSSIFPRPNGSASSPSTSSPPPRCAGRRPGTCCERRRIDRQYRLDPGGTCRCRPMLPTWRARAPSLA